MFGMSAERSVAQRPPRIDTGGTIFVRYCLNKKLPDRTVRENDTIYSQGE